MKLTILLNGQRCEVQRGITLAAALAGSPSRRSVSGKPRAALCGMGICHECRVTVDGHAQQRACQVLVREGMEVECEA
ncbi:MAG: (2Fe-2S)-binding protein [Burkholderiales bacterium]|nr:(2Fe-2S)-binding protein [Burkholderiales bacterium]